MDNSTRAATGNCYGTYTSEYVPKGRSKKGLTKDNTPCKTVRELSYGLTEEQAKVLSIRFPAFAFVPGLEAHDHPVAHTSAKIVQEIMYNRFLKPGERVADLSGNPAVVENFNKSQRTRRQPIVVDCFVSVNTPKDEVRKATRWGPPQVQDRNGVRIRWVESDPVWVHGRKQSGYDGLFENVEDFAVFDKYIMHHSLYYYSPGEITSLLNAPGRQKVLVASLHRLPGKSGFINGGEQRYDKDELTGFVTQTNVETGETYEHVDPARWFDRTQYADANGGITWTIHKGCDDTYILEIVRCNPRIMDPRHIEGWKDPNVAIVEPIERDPPKYKPREVVLSRQTIWGDGKHSVLAPTDAKDIRVKILDEGIYENLKVFMINKPRNLTTLKDLTQRAQRDTGHSSLFGGKTRVDIPSDALSGMIMAAFLDGIKNESCLLDCFSSDNHRLYLTRQLTGGHFTGSSLNGLLRTGIKAAIMVNDVRASTDPLTAALKLADAHS